MSSQASPVVPNSTIVLTAAILSDEVYHNANDTVIPPQGWTFLTNQYDQSTGYYGEAWGQPNGLGGYSSVIVVNRGTSLAGVSGNSISPVNLPGSTLQSQDTLNQNSLSDSVNNLATDGQIVFGLGSGYLDQSSMFLNYVSALYSPTTLYNTGQSLGGAAVQYDAVNDPTLSAVGLTFNALSWDSYQSQGNNQTFNFALQNETLTRGFLTNLAQEVLGFFAPEVGTNIQTPALPTASSFTDLLAIHSTTSAEISYIQSLGVGTPAYIQAIQLLQYSYSGSMVPADIAAFLNGQTPSAVGTPAATVMPDGSISLFGSLNISGAAVGQIFGSALGHALAGNNQFSQIAVGTAFSGLGTDLGGNITAWVNAGFPDFSATLFSDTKQLLGDVGAAIPGAIGSFLGGELINALGIKGLGGQVASDAAGSVLSTVATNISEGVTGSDIFDGIGAKLPSALGSFFGSELGSLVLSPDSLGGQIGSQIGSGLGGLAGASIVDTGFGTAIDSAISDAVGDVVGAATIGNFIFPLVGAFVGYLLGTFIGDLFSSTPSPQTYYNISAVAGPTGGTFTAAFRSSKDNGPTATVASIATAIVADLNDALASSGGTLTNPGQLPHLVVGIRRGVAELIGPAGDQKFYGSQAIDQLISTAVFQELAGVKIVGGDVFVRRAIQAAAASAFTGGQLTSDPTALSGDIAVAKDYESYLSNPSVVDTEIASNPNSTFAATWETELTQAAALGLDQRNVADWNAGWDGFLQNQKVDPTQVTFTYSGNERQIVANGTIIHDTIDTTDKTIIHGDNTPGQTITVLDNVLQTASAGALTANGAAVTAPLTIPIAAMIYGGNGAGDVIWAGNQGNDVFGGTGNDTIYGYSSAADEVAAATWIEGGNGSDKIVAGISSGDYLLGGAGNDTINASLTNSAWIDGGTGNNTLIGGAGNDVITAEGASTASNAATSTFYTDAITGGGGTDTYIIAPGTIDTINNAPVGNAGAAGTIELTGIASFSQVDAHAYTGTVTALVGSLEIDLFAPSATGTSNTSNYSIAVPSTDVIGRIYVENYRTAAADRVQYLQLSDGTKFDISNLGTNFIQGTPGADFLEGSQGADSIFGDGGTDTVEAFGGSDFVVGDGLLSGGSGNDTILGGNASDTIWGGAGSNDLDGGGGSNFILGAAFDTVASDFDTIHGGAAGPSGTNTVIGGPNGNLFEYGLGDGAQQLYASLAQSAWHTVWTSTGGWFHLAGKAAEFARDVTTDALSGDITLTTQGALDLGLPSAAVGEAIFYADQTTLPGGTVVAANTMNGIVDVEDNYAGISKTGAGQGTAESQIYWQTALTSASDTRSTLQFGAGITPDELLFQRSGNDLLIGINDGNTNPNGTPGTFGALADQVTIRNSFTSGAIGALQFVSSSGTTTTLSLTNSTTGIGYIIEAPTVASGNSTVSAPAGATAAQTYWITGGYGNDLLIGGPGNDVLTAGPNGIDTLEGGGGADTLIGTGQTWASYANAIAGVSASLAGQSGSITYAPAARIRALAAPAAGEQIDMPRLWHSGFWQPGASLGQLPGTAASTPAANAAANTAYVGITGLIGSAFADTLTAAAGGSSLDGGGGSDLLVGGAGNDDFVYDMAPTGALAYGADTIQLGGGADSLDIVDPGGPGVTFDQLAFASSNGTLVISQGSHKITVLGLASAGETLTLTLDGDTSATFSGLPVSGSVGLAVGGAAATTVTGGSSIASAVIAGGAANDSFVGLSGADTFIAGNETVAGGTGHDTITGGTAGASVNGGVTANTVSFAGASLGVTLTLAKGATGLASGGATGDVFKNIQNLVGSSQADLLTGDANANVIDGGFGNDTINGGGGNDTLIGRGVDVIGSGTGNALLSVADCTITGAGSTLTGGAGNDTLYGGAGNDTLTDTGSLAGTIFSSSLSGGAGNDILTGTGNDTLDGGGGRDTLIASTGNSLLEDSNSTATLVGGTGNDTLFAGAGTNIIFAGSANSVLISDQGSSGVPGQGGTISATSVNTLWAQAATWSVATGATFITPPDLTLAGNDTFELSSQSGTTVLHAWYGVNEVAFDTSVDYANLVLTRNGTDLDITDPSIASPFEIVLGGFFSNTVGRLATAPVFRDITDDGQVLFLSQLANSTANSWVTSSSGTAPPGTGTLVWQPSVSATDTITGLDGSSLLKGSNYNNVITSSDLNPGGANVDTLIAGGGTNILTAAAASAIITGGSVADTIVGGTDSNTITGGSGAESITGGATLASNAGATNSFTAGSGTDTINGAASANVNIVGGSGTDLLEAGSGSTTIHGGAGLATITGGSGADTIIGGLGAATITAGTGTSLITSAQGADLIYGNGTDTIQTGAGTDTIHLHSASGTTQLSTGNVSLYGGWGSDTITMAGTNAATRDLIDDVSDTAGGGTVGGSLDILQGAGIDTIIGAEGVTVDFSAALGGIVVNTATGQSSGAAAGDQITNAGTVIGSGFADNLTASGLGSVVLIGGPGNDTLSAGIGYDTLQDVSVAGAAGNDVLYGYNSSDSAALAASSATDVFTVYNGNNTIYGGNNNNVYNILGGNATIQQATRPASTSGSLYADLIKVSASSSNSLTLIGPAAYTGSIVQTELSFQYVGLQTYDLWFTRSGNDLVVKALGTNGTDDTVDLQGWFSNVALQNSLAYQLFDAVSLPGAYALTSQGTQSYYSGGVTVLAVNGLVAVDSQLATPANAAAAAADYNSQSTTVQVGGVPVSFQSALDPLWKPNHPPTIGFSGPSNGTITEQVSSSSSASVLTFGITVADVETPASLLKVTATSPSGGSLTASTPVAGASPYAGTSTVTFTLNNAQDWLTANIPIVVTVTDGGGLSASETFTTSVQQVNPRPTFVTAYGSLTFSEGGTLGAKGASANYQIVVDHLTSQDVDDAGSIALTATSSNQALISSGDIHLTQSSGGTWNLSLYSEAGVYGSDTITFTATSNASAANGGVTTATTVTNVTVAEAAITPVLSVATSETYNESSTSQTYDIPFSVTGANVSPAVTTAQGANAWWLTPSIVNIGGQSYIQLVEAANSWTNSGAGQPNFLNSNITLTATANQGAAGTSSTTATIAITSNYVHQNFTVIAPSAITLNEGSGFSNLTGLGSFTESPSNSDKFSYTLTQNPDNAFFVNTSGTIFQENPIAWIPGGSNTYTLGVTVANASFSHTGTTTVTIKDASAPTVYFSAVETSAGEDKGFYITGINVSAPDPHSLQSSFTLSNAPSNEYTYSISSTAPGTNGSTAYIRVQDVASEDPERESITVTATNSQGISSSQSFTFTLGDPDVSPDVAVGDQTAQLTQAIASFTTPSYGSAALVSPISNTPSTAEATLMAGVHH